MTLRKLSTMQSALLDAMKRHATENDGIHQARQIAQWTGQSSDGAAYTLRSLVRRGLVEVVRHDGERGGYRLAGEGEQQ